MMYLGSKISYCQYTLYSNVFPQNSHITNLEHRLLPTHKGISLALITGGLLTINFLKTAKSVKLPKFFNLRGLQLFISPKIEPEILFLILSIPRQEMTAASRQSASKVVAPVSNWMHMTPTPLFQQSLMTLTWSPTASEYKSPRLTFLALIKCSSLRALVAFPAYSTQILKIKNWIKYISFSLTETPQRLLIKDKNLSKLKIK